MKINSTQEDKKFKPITLNITFESVEELNAFYHRMYVSSKVISCNTEIDKIPFDMNNDDELNSELFTWVANTIDNL